MVSFVLLSLSSPTRAATSLAMTSVKNVLGVGTRGGLSSISAYHMVAMSHSTMAVLARRRVYGLTNSTLSSSSSYSSTAYILQLMQRWRRNFARLYARRLLELALASAAIQAARRGNHCHASTHSTTTAMESNAIRQPQPQQSKPLDWKNWSRRDWTDDLLASLGSTKWQRLWSATSRLVQLSLLASPFCILIPLSYVHDTFHDYSWQYALWSIEQAGPTFVKCVQWATTRQDLFSPEFCRYFGKLQSDTVGHSWKETVNILQQEFAATSLAEIEQDHHHHHHHHHDNDDDKAAEKNRCDDAKQLKQQGTTTPNLPMELEKEPIGSGCIAQVYRGTLTKAVGLYPAGTKLAVKVQHPGIWHKVCVDFYVMAKVAQFLEDLPYLNLRFLSPVDTVRQFRDLMLPQMDFQLEASHLNRFNRDFAHDDRVHFPKPLADLTTTRVLTETFLAGNPILEHVNAPLKDRAELANLGLETTLKMIFLHDFLHGDLHPGNILVHRAEAGHLQLNLLDCGLVVEMGPGIHVNVTKILGAFVRRHGREAGKLMVDTSSDCQASDEDVELFVQAIQDIVEMDSEQNFVENVGDYITDICYLACRHKVKLEASFINAALAVEIMEGIASALYSDIRVVPTALPLVLKAELMHNLNKFKVW